jgi:hypothetical protein
VSTTVNVIRNNSPELIATLSKSRFLGPKAHQNGFQTGIRGGSNQSTMGAGIGIMISPLKTRQLKDYESQSIKNGGPPPAYRVAAPHLTLTTKVISAI